MVIIMVRPTIGEVEGEAFCSCMIEVTQGSMDRCIGRGLAAAKKRTEDHGQVGQNHDTIRRPDEFPHIIAPPAHPHSGRLFTCIATQGRNFMNFVSAKADLDGFTVKLGFDHDDTAIDRRL